MVSKLTLLDLPVSNHGGRVRFVIYSKCIESLVDIASPAVFGGLKSPQYLALNPQGKMPVLLCPDGLTLPESEVISSYLLDRFLSHAPTFLAETPELRARAALMTRYMDLYIHTIQGCMYRKMERAEDRLRDLKQIMVQLDHVEALAVEGGPHLVGTQVTGADAALLPTVALMEYMLSLHFGWAAGAVLGGRPRLAAWWAHITTHDAAGQRVVAEIRSGLDSWHEGSNWKDSGIDEQMAAQPQLQWCC